MTLEGSRAVELLNLVMLIVGPILTGIVVAELFSTHDARNDQRRHDKAMRELVYQRAMWGTAKPS